MTLFFLEIQSSLHLFYLHVLIYEDLFAHRIFDMFTFALFYPGFEFLIY